MLETAGLQLLFEIHRQQRPAFVDWLESWHPVSPRTNPLPSSYARLGGGSWKGSIASTFELSGARLFARPPERFIRAFRAHAETLQHLP